MLFDLTFNDWVGNVGAAIGITMFILGLLYKNLPKIAMFFLFAIIFAVITFGIKYFDLRSHDAQVDIMRARIISTIGNREETFDQIRENVIGLSSPDPKIFYEAFESLDNKQQLLHQMVSANVTQQQTVSVKLWRVRTDGGN